MPALITIHEKPGYLHCVITGENTRENAMGYVRQLVEECKVRQCYRLLIEERLEGPRMRTTDLYEMVTEACGMAIGLFRAVAYVDVYGIPEMLAFTENVAINRGLPVAAFRTVAEAEKWMQSAFAGEVK